MRRSVGLALVALAVVLLGVPASAGAAGRDVTVWDTAGARPVPCPPIDLGDPADPRGGCAVEAHSRDIEIVIRTVVGDMIFGTCGYEYDMRIDATGRTYLEGISPGGPSPCNDMQVCDYGDNKPWWGQIEAMPDGGLTHVVDACLDTCMGQFAGKLRLGLERVDGRWVQTADHALVGRSGYQIDGGWDYEERDFDIRPRPSAGGDAAGAWRLTGKPVGWPI